MKLKELLNGISVLETAVDPELEITGLAYDSRHVEPWQGMQPTATGLFRWHWKKALPP